jgi:hypothetical protein
MVQIAGPVGAVVFDDIALDGANLATAGVIGDQWQGGGSNTSFAIRRINGYALDLKTTTSTANIDTFGLSFNRLYLRAGALIRMNGNAIPNANCCHLTFGRVYGSYYGVNDRTVTDASISGTTLTSASANFTAADVGLVVESAAGGTLATEITGFTDSSHVTVNLTGTIVSSTVTISAPAINIINADNNDYLGTYLYAETGALGRSVWFGYRARSQYFYHLEASSKGVRATVPNAPALNGNMISNYDVNNSQPLPVVDSTASLAYTVTGSPTLSAPGPSGGSALQLIPGIGSPLGSVAAPVGSLFFRTDGSSRTALQIKGAGTDANGWIPAAVDILVNTTTSGTATATYTICNANAGAITQTLPSAAGITGRPFMFKKTDSSVNAVTIQTTGGQTIADTGGSTYVLNQLGQTVVLVSDGTNWQVHSFRAIPVGGTTGQALVKNSNANFDLVWSTVTGGGGGSGFSTVASITADPAPAVVSTYYLGNATGAAFPITLPTAVGNSAKLIGAKKTDGSTNAITLQTTGGQTIDGVATFVLPAAGASIEVISDGANWQIVATSMPASSLTLDEFAAPVNPVAMGGKNFVNLGQAITAQQAPTVGQLAGNAYAYIVSGCVWTPDAPGSTLNGSMSSGTIMIGGILLTVAAISAHAFTANQDTYIDFQDNGDGTGKVVYTGVAGNATPPTLGNASRSPYDTLRLAVITSGATSLSANSVNQGSPSFGGPGYSGNSGLNVLRTATIGSGSNGNPITTATLAVSANSLTPSGYAMVDTSAGTGNGYASLISYSSGGGTTTLSGIVVLSGSGTVATAGVVTQVSQQTVCDMLGNLIAPSTPNPKIIASRAGLGSFGTTSTASVPLPLLTTPFIVPPGPPRLVRFSANGSITSTAVAGSTLTANIAVATLGGSFGGAASFQGKVAVSGDGFGFTPIGVVQLAPGSWVAELAVQQGAAGTLTVGGVLFLTQLLVALE